LPTATSNDATIVVDLIMNEISGYLNNLLNFIPIFDGDLHFNIHKTSHIAEIIKEFMLRHTIVILLILAPTGQVSLG